MNFIPEKAKDHLDPSQINLERQQKSFNVLEGERQGKIKTGQETCSRPG
jgi:hypothetical protein